MDQFADDGHGFHRWDGVTIDNSITPWGEARVSIELTAAAHVGYALEVTDGDDRKRVGVALTYRGSDRSVSIVRFVPRAAIHRHVGRRAASRGARRPHLVAPPGLVRRPRPPGAAAKLPGPGPARTRLRNGLRPHRPARRAMRRHNRDIWHNFSKLNSQRRRAGRSFRPIGTTHSVVVFPTVAPGPP